MINHNEDLNSLKLDLSGLELEDIEVFLQEGSRGMPDFAASTGTNCCSIGACSCVKETPKLPGPILA